MEPDLSIIIPTYNEEFTIGPTIFEIYNILKRTPASFEILVVDDNSPDKTGKIVKEMSPRLPLAIYQLYNPDEIEAGRIVLKWKSSFKEEMCGVV